MNFRLNIDVPEFCICGACTGGSSIFYATLGMSCLFPFVSQILDRVQEHLGLSAKMWKLKFVKVVRMAVACKNKHSSYGKLSMIVVCLLLG